MKNEKYYIDYMKEKSNPFQLHILHSSLFISCSDDLTNVSEDEFIDPRLTRGYSDEQIKLQRLGYAYNAAGNVMDDSSFSTKPVINMERLKAAESEYGLIINSERRHYTSMDIFSGNTLQELGHQETKYTIDDSEAIGSGKYYRKNNTHYQGTWHNSYKAHMFIKHIMATMTIDVGMLHCLKLDDLNDKKVCSMQNSAMSLPNWSRTERVASTKTMPLNSLRSTARTSWYLQIWEE